MLIDTGIQRDLHLQLLIVIINILLEILRVVFSLFVGFEYGFDALFANLYFVTLLGKAWNFGFEFLDYLKRWTEAILDCLLEGDRVVYLAFYPVEYVLVGVFKFMCEGLILCLPSFADK